MTDGIEFRLSPPLDNATLNALYAVSWPAHEAFDFASVLGRSLATSSITSPDLAPFYAACGFAPTSAGVIRLKP